MSEVTDVDLGRLIERVEALTSMVSEQSVEISALNQRIGTLETGLKLTGARGWGLLAGVAAGTVAGWEGLQMIFRALMRSLP
jgi:hypothetical protein